MRILVTLSEDVLRELDGLVDSGKSRSEVVERLLLEALSHRRERLRPRDDLEIINAHADELNEEAADVLGYRATPR